MSDKYLPFPTKVENTIDKYKMLSPTKALLVGVSGGSDSICLLYVMKAICEKRGISLAAAHINHHIRGEESDRDRDFVKDICRKWDIPIFVLEGNVLEKAQLEHISTEEAGRAIRYEFFQSSAQKMGEGTLIATAHSLSDSAETALFNMARGTTLSGLCGIPPIRGNIIRPLIEVTKEEIIKYCEDEKLPFVTDSTNLEDAYARNRLRHHAIPAMKSVNQSFEKAFLRMSNSLSLDKALLDELTKQALEKAKTQKGYDGALLSKEPPAIKTRAAAYILKSFGFSADYERITLLAQCFGKADFKEELSKGKYLCQKAGEVFLLEKEEAPTPIVEHKLKLGVNKLSDGRSLILTEINGENEEISKKINQCSFKNMLESDKIKGTLTVRSRIEGDKICLGGARRSLKKIFNEKKIPVNARMGVAVVAYNGTPVWVEGLGADKSFCATPKTKNALLIEIK